MSLNFEVWMAAYPPLHQSCTQLHLISELAQGSFHPIVQGINENAELCQPEHWPLGTPMVTNWQLWTFDHYPLNVSVQTEFMHLVVHSSHPVWLQGYGRQHWSFAEIKTTYILLLFHGSELVISSQVCQVWFPLTESMFAVLNYWLIL